MKSDDGFSVLQAKSGRRSIFTREFYVFRLTILSLSPPYTISQRTQCNNYFIWLCQINQCEASIFLVCNWITKWAKHKCLLCVIIFMQTKYYTLWWAAGPLARVAKRLFTLTVDTKRCDPTTNGVAPLTVQYLRESHSIPTPRNLICVCDCHVITAGIGLNWFENLLTFYDKQTQAAGRSTNNFINTLL